MEVTKGKLYGVVTGDVVASSKLSPPDRERLFAVMKEASRELRQWLGEAMPLEVDIYGGDSWQILLATPGKALAAALFFRAYLRAHPPHCDSRFAVAIGPIDFVPGKNVSEGDGDAFRRSGQMLEGGLGKRRMGFAPGAPHPPSNQSKEDTHPSAGSSAAQSNQDTQHYLRSADDGPSKEDTHPSHEVAESSPNQDTHPSVALAGGATPSWDLVYEILDAVVSRWTEKQARAATGALRGWTQEQTGKLWTPPIEQSTVNRTLRAARWPALARAIEEFEETWDL